MQGDWKEKIPIQRSTKIDNIPIFLFYFLSHAKLIQCFKTQKNTQLQDLIQTNVALNFDLFTKGAAQWPICGNNSVTERLINFSSRVSGSIFGLGLL